MAGQYKNSEEWYPLIKTTIKTFSQEITKSLC